LDFVFAWLLLACSHAWAMQLDIHWLAGHIDLAIMATPQSMKSPNLSAYIYLYTRRNKSNEANVVQTTSFSPQEKINIEDVF
jgi:hypothetical protein